MSIKLIQNVVGSAHVEIDPIMSILCDDACFVIWTDDFPYWLDQLCELIGGEVFHAGRTPNYGGADAWLIRGDECRVAVFQPTSDLAA